jgi:hypothetical protein
MSKEVTKWLVLPYYPDGVWVFEGTFIESATQYRAASQPNYNKVVQACGGKCVFKRGTVNLFDTEQEAYNYLIDFHHQKITEAKKILDRELVNLGQAYSEFRHLDVWASYGKWSV